MDSGESRNDREVNVRHPTHPHTPVVRTGLLYLIYDPRLAIKRRFNPHTLLHPVVTAAPQPGPD